MESAEYETAPALVSNATAASSVLNQPRSSRSATVRSSGFGLREEKKKMTRSITRPCRLAIRRFLVELTDAWRSLPPLLQLILAFRGTVKRRGLRLALCSGSNQPRRATLVQAGAPPEARRAA
jgi:hypothetical protein